MKRVFQFIVVICMLASISNAAFDYVISDTYEYGVFRLINSVSLLVTGAGASHIDARDSSYIEIQNTSPLIDNTGGIYTLSLNDNGTVHSFGGEIGNFDIYDNSSAVFQGGRVDYINSHQYILQPNQEVLRHIEIVCDTHVFDDSTNYLSGTWMDGSSFGIQLVDQDDYDRVIDNIFFTPEPATLLLLGLGGLALRKRRRV